MDSRGSGRRKAVWTLFACLLLSTGAQPGSVAQPGGTSPASTQAQAGSARLAGAAAQPGRTPPLPAWQWTVEERLAKRYDPKAMAARAAAACRSARLGWSDSSGFCDMAAV